MRSKSLVVFVSLFLAACFSQGQTAAIISSEDATPEDLQRRIEYLRRHGLTDSSAEVLLRDHALEKLHSKTQLRSQASRESSATNAALTWTPIGPKPLTSSASFFSGRISSIAIDPNTPSTLYIGAGQGGVWKTTDSGQNWAPLTDSQPTQSIGSVAVDPSNSQIIYAATGDSFGYRSGIGILRSSDGGQNWQLISEPFVGDLAQHFLPNLFINSVAVHPNGSIVLAASNLGIYRSADAGRTFKNVTGVVGADTGNIVFDPVQPTNVYAGWRGSGGLEIRKSTDSGFSWRNVLSIPEPSSDGRIALAISRSNPAVLYAAFGFSASGSATLYKSVDRGETWQQLTASNLCSNQCFYNLAIEVNPADSNDVYFGAVAAYHSFDGGENWTRLASSHADFHAFAFTSGADRIYAGNDGGIFTRKTSDIDSNAWDNLNITLNTVLFYTGISMAAGDPSFALGGTQDNGAAYFHSGSWQVLPIGDGYETAIDSASRFGYVTGNFAGVGRIASDNILQNASTGIDPSDEGNGVLAIDPQSPQRLYYGAKHLYLSTDSAAHWNSIYDGDYVHSVAVSPANSEVVYMLAGTCYVCVTSNASAGASASWTWSSSGLPTNRISIRVTAHPRNADIAFLTYSMNSYFFSGQPGVIFRTTDRGQHWNNISGDLPDLKVFDLAIDPAADTTYYAATDIGVFTTVNGGTNWALLGQGLPTAAITGILLDASTHTLRVGTYGRGMWDLHLAAPPPPPPPAGDFALTLTPTTVDSAAGQSFKIALSLTPSAGFTGNVALSCQGLPTGATCTFDPATVAINASNAATANLTVALPQVMASAATPLNSSPWPAFTLLPVGLFFTARSSRGNRKLSRRAKGKLQRHINLLGVFLVALSIAQIGCGGGVKTEPAAPALQPQVATTRAIQITIQATSGSISHTQILTVRVPQ